MTMTITTTLISLFTTALFLIATSQQQQQQQQPPPPPPPPPSSCSDELVSLSPCLGYISAPPNNVTENVTSQCCDAFESGSDDTCMCYLLRQPLIFGFPLNESRVLSLSSVCSLKNDSFLARSGSLESFCSVSPALPPLHSNTGSGTSKPSDSGPKNASTPSRSLAPGSNLLNSPPDSAVRSARPPTSSAELARGSPPMKLVYNSTSWFLPGALVLLIFFHM